MVAVVDIRDEGLGNSSWLVDLGDGSALVIDPRRDPRPSLSAAQRRGLRVRVVAETHLHADFVSGARELVHAVGATILAPRDARLAFPHTSVRDSDEIDLGGLTLRVLATPGHTPEHVAFLLADGDAPVALFSGGTLIVGGTARPDLISPEQTEPLARAAWRSLTERLLPLPDDLAVYPTHGGGSFCSTGASAETITTIGTERAGNPLLQVTTEDAFVDRLLDDLGSYPGYFRRLRDVNRAGPRLYGVETPPLRGLDVAAAREVVAAGGVVVDVRSVASYAAAHISASLSIELRDSFATWLGWLIDDLATPLVFVVDDGQDGDDLVRQCLGIGYEHLAGEIVGGVDAWTDAGQQLASTRVLDQPAAGVTVLDVRQASEWRQGHVPGAVHIELGALADRATAVPAGRVVAHCMHGQRSMTAASVLERAGRDDVAVFTGGPDEWAAATGTP
ncbi:MAG: MBL fold metallo-hydrolase [Actinobacteria bacterium]|nr:MBL fold metallo-hydrolase [Actinomycetota bacterium]